MNEQFKNKQNEVALRYGFTTWSSIKWFELQQSFDHDGIKVPAFDVLLAEVVKEFHDEVYSEAFNAGHHFDPAKTELKQNEDSVNSFVSGSAQIVIASSPGITETIPDSIPVSYTANVTLETVDLSAPEETEAPVKEESKPKRGKKKEEGNV